MRVLANEGISQKGIDALNEAGIEVVEHRVSQGHLVDFINANNIDVLLVKNTSQVRRELIDACPGLKAIGKGGAVMDNIDVEYAIEKGLYLFNTPNASTRAVAEMVFAHFFALARFLHESNRLMPLEGETKFSSLKNSFSKARELSGKTLGVIGFENIGKEVAKMGISLGMKVKVLTEEPTTETLILSFFDGQEVNFTIDTTNDWNTFLNDTDFISITTTKSQEYMIDAPQFEMMKNGVYIVNTAKGGVINEVTLIDYIENGKVAGAALDVFEKEPRPELPILMNPALSLSPNLAELTVDAQEKIGIKLAEKIIEIKKKL